MLKKDLIDELKAELLKEFTITSTGADTITANITDSGSSEDGPVSEDASVPMCPHSPCPVPSTKSADASELNSHHQAMEVAFTPGKPPAADNRLEENEEGDKDDDRVEEEEDNKEEIVEAVQDNIEEAVENIASKNNEDVPTSPEANEGQNASIAQDSKTPMSVDTEATKSTVVAAKAQASQKSPVPEGSSSSSQAVEKKVTNTSDHRGSMESTDTSYSSVITSLR